MSGCQVAQYHLADILSNEFPIRDCHFGSPVLSWPSERAEQALRESEEHFRSWQIDPAGVGDGLAAMGGVEGQSCKKRSTARELGNVGTLGNVAWFIFAAFRVTILGTLRTPDGLAPI